MKHIKHIILLLILLVLASKLVRAQETIYGQDFTAANGTTSGADWAVITSGGCGLTYDFGVVNNAFQIKRARGFDCGCNGTDLGNNQNVVEFGPIDISNHCDVSVDLAITATANMQCADNGSSVPLYCNDALGFGHDMLWVEIIIDGVAQTLRYYCGNFRIVNNMLTGLNGNSMTIRVTGGNQANPEVYTIDDLIVEGTPSGGGAVTITANPSTSICEGESVTLTVEGPGPYDWSTGSTDQSITVDPNVSTNYSVTAGSGCGQGDDNQQITVFPLPNATVDDKTICSGESTTLTAPAGGSSYTWTGGRSGRTITVDPASTTTYSLTVTSGPGCSATGQATVFVNQGPNVQTGGNQEVCEGETVTLTANGADSYVWSYNNRSGSSISFEPDASETYTVTGTTNGCSSDAQVSVTVKPKPIAQITGASQICTGDDLTLSANGQGSFEWSTTETTVSIMVEPATSQTYSLTVTDNGCSGVATHDVNVQSMPNADAGNDRAICDGQTIALTASGGTSYEWDNGENTQTINVGPMINTTYTVTVTNGICTATDNVNITVIPLPSASIDGNLEICEGASTTLTAVGNGTYSWTHNNSSASTIGVSPSATTDYTLIVTQNGCSNSTTSTVIVKPSPNVDAGPDITICEGGTTTLNATGADSYMWSTGEEESSIMVTTSTIQRLRVTGVLDDCSASDEVIIFVQPKITADAGTDQEICEGNTATLNASGGVSYAWSDGSSEATTMVVPGSTTTYVVTATDRACTDTDEVEIVVTAGFAFASTPDTTVCQGSDLTLSIDAPPEVTYLWEDGSIADQLEIQASTSENYSVTVSDGICEVIHEIAVAVDDINIDLTGSSNELCTGSNIDLSITSNGSFTWPDGDTESFRNLNFTKDTTINVTATSSIGCEAEDQWIIIVHPIPEVVISGQAYFCPGSETEVSATPNLASYSWQDGNESQIRTLDAPGTYTVSVMDNNGCTNSAEINIVENESPTPDIVGSLTFCPGSSTTLSVDQTYMSQEWTFNNTPATTPNFVVSENGTVTLTVTDHFGCIGFTEATIESNSDLNPIISGDPTLCENTSGQLDAGSGFDQYEWSTGASTQIIDVDASDIYSVTVSTNDGCSGSSTFEVSVVPNPTVSISGELAFCENGSTILSIPTFDAIEWSTGAVLETVEINSPGSVNVEITDVNGCVSTDEVTVIEHSNPTADIIGDLSFCEDESTRLMVEGDYRSVVWSNGISDGSIDVDAAGVVDVVVEDQNGCTDVDQVTVVQNPKPNPEIVAPSIICEGSEAKIYTTETYNSYNWNNNIELDTQTISAGGMYRIVVTDDNGCQGLDEVNIDESEAPFVEFKSNLTLCNVAVENRNEPLAINLDTTFISKNIDGTWSSNAVNLDFSNLPIVSFEGVDPGSYEFTYRSTNAILPCEEISRTITLEVLNCQCPDVQFQAIAPLCSLSDVLDLSSIQSSNFDGSWQIVEGPAANLPSIDGDVFNAMDQMPGDYRLEFRLNDGIAPLGCAESKSVNLTVLEYVDASIELINPACGGNAATFRLNLAGGNSNFNVEILQDDGTMISLDNIADGHTFDLAIGGATTLSFADITSSSNTCGFRSSQTSYTFEPSQLDGQLQLIETFGDFGVSCASSSDGAIQAQIETGIAPFDYAWSNGETTSNITGLSAGIYQVSVLDAAGCEFVSSIEVSAPPEKQIEITPEDPNCGQGPGRIFLNAAAGIKEGEWELYLDGILRSETSIPAIFNNIEPGAHTLEAINSDGCMESHSFNIQGDNAYSINVNDVNVELGQSAFLNLDINFAYESIQWSPSIYLSDSNGPSVSVLQPLNTTNYTVVVTDADGCVFSQMVTVNVDKERVLDMPTGFTPNGDANNDAFIIHAQSNVVMINNLSVFDRWGEQVFTVENVVPNQPINWDWTFRNKPLPEGQYVWRANATFIDAAEVDFNGKFYILR